MVGVSMTQRTKSEIPLPERLVNVAVYRLCTSMISIALSSEHEAERIQNDNIALLITRIPN